MCAAAVPAHSGRMVLTEASGSATRGGAELGPVGRTDGDRPLSASLSRLVDQLADEAQELGEEGSQHDHGHERHERRTAEDEPVLHDALPA